MILYYTLTRYQQLASILHKVLFAPEEDAHLYMSNGNHIEPAYIDRLKESGFFSEVSILNDQPAWAMGVDVNFKHEENLNPALKDITKLCMESLLQPIETYDNIYILADHFPFGYMCAYNQIPYHYVEEAAGVHCCYELWMQKLIEQKNDFLYLIAKNVGVYGSSECVIDCLVDIDKQEDGYTNDKAVDFSIPKLLKELDEVNLAKILKVFNVAEISTKDDQKGVALILTEYLASAKVCTWEEQRMIYGMFIDFFCDNLQVIIKPHPNDHQGTYSEWFPQTVVLNKEAPSELIPCCINGKIDKIISICSTSFMSLQHIAKDVYSFRNKDLRTEKLFKHMNKYYVASQLINQINEKYCVFGIGADTHQVEYFLMNDGIRDIDIYEYDRTDFPKFNQRRIIVVDDLSYSEQLNEFDIQDMLINAKEDDVFIFIDSKKDVLFFLDEDNSWAEYTVPIKIIETSYRKNLESKEGWIFMITKDNELRRVFLNTRIDKMLENAGLRVEVNNDDASIRERILEGMLYATEQKCIMLTHRK